MVLRSANPRLHSIRTDGPVPEVNAASGHTERSRCPAASPPVRDGGRGPLLLTPCWLFNVPSSILHLHAKSRVDVGIGHVLPSVIRCGVDAHPIPLSFQYSLVAAGTIWHDMPYSTAIRLSHSDTARWSLLDLDTRLHCTSSIAIICPPGFSLRPAAASEQYHRGGLPLHSPERSCRPHP